jgi:hypothetical protein
MAHVVVLPEARRCARKDGVDSNSTPPYEILIVALSDSAFGVLLLVIATSSAVSAVAAWTGVWRNWARRFPPSGGRRDRDGKACRHLETEPAR